MVHEIRTHQDADQKFEHILVNILTPVVVISVLLLRLREIQVLEQVRCRLIRRTGIPAELLRSTARSVVDGLDMFFDKFNGWKKFSSGIVNRTRSRRNASKLWLSTGHSARLLTIMVLYRVQT